MLFVSAIVPVYNSKSTLARAVNSLLIQKEINEIFLVDDGSTDGSEDLCKELESQNSMIKVLNHPNRINKGAPASRNLGLFKAKNKWIQFLDADDECLEGKISKQLGLVKNDVSIVVSPFLYLKEGARLKFTPRKDPWSGLISTRLGTTSSNLWNGEIMKKAGGWDEKLINVQEYFMMFEILKVNENAVFLFEPLCKVYYRPESITNSNRMIGEKRDNYFSFRSQVRDFLIRKNKFSLPRFHFYTICTGSMLKYHKPSFPVEVNNLYFRIYKKARIMRNSFKRIGLSIIILPFFEIESILL